MSTMNLRTWFANNLPVVPAQAATHERIVPNWLAQLVPMEHTGKTWTDTVRENDGAWVITKRKSWKSCVTGDVFDLVRNQGVDPKNGKQLDGVRLTEAGEELLARYVAQRFLAG